MTSVMFSLFGPRVSNDELLTRGARYALPTVVLTAARILLIVSVFFPYWSMVLEAPQYPDGLGVIAYVNTLSGDVAEVNGLNHYIGMRPLEEAANFERATAVWMVLAMFLLIELAAIVHSRWALLLVLPAMLFPLGFLADLQFWLYHFGQNLDPSAPLSSSVKPFTSPALGVGEIGQFKTVARVETGWWLACASSLLVIAGIFLHRRAYKPLFETAAREREAMRAAA